MSQPKEQAGVINDRLKDHSEPQFQRQTASPSEDCNAIAADSHGLTRREWILRLGEAAVLAGFSGSVVEAVASNAAMQGAPSPTPLPPGLYGPSGEHMAHVLLRDERFITPPPGSETEYVLASASFKPAFFSEEDFQIARRLVGLILNSPADSATANAIQPADAQTIDEIAEWIDLMLSQSAATREAAKDVSAQHQELAAHYYGEDDVRQRATADPEATWKAGLASINSESKRIAGQPFLSLTESQQIQLLKSIGDSDTQSSTARASSDAAADGIRFYRLLKSQTIRGYYTSKAGLKELDYKGNAFYPESPGCPNK